MIKIKRLIAITTSGSIYEMEDNNFIETVETRSNGETMRAWYTDEIGTPLHTPDFEVRPCYEQDLDNEDNYNLVGFEKVV